MLGLSHVPINKAEDIGIQEKVSGSTGVPRIQKGRRPGISGNTGITGRQECKSFRGQECCQFRKAGVQEPLEVLRC